MFLMMIDFLENHGFIARKIFRDIRNVRSTKQQKI